MTDPYIEFLKRKIPRAEVAGFEPPSPCHESLKPHQRDICEWAIRGGRRAIFASFGLGKTRMNIQIAKWVTERGGRFLIIAPLGVRQEFITSDGPAMGVNIEYVTTDAEVLASKCRILITNYERVRDGGISLTHFDTCGLDEASCLRSYGSKTYQTFLTALKAVALRFVFTATPSPNRHKELIHYAAILGIMDSGEALTRFFQRDSEQANNLTLMPHMEQQFWLWISSWAVFLNKPSDLGYSDEGYDLPPMRVHWHKLECDQRKAWTQVDSWGQVQLLRDDAHGLAEGAEIKRESIDLRITRALEIMAGHEPERHWIIWHDLEAERDALERRLPRTGKGRHSKPDGWRTAYGNQDLEEREDAIMAFARGEYRTLGTKPSIAGSGTNLQRHCADAIFLGVGYKFNDFIQAVHRIFRFQQLREVNIHIIYLDSESAIAEALKEKWRRHDELVGIMTAILRKYRLSNTSTMELIRTLTIGNERAEVRGERFIIVNNDCVLELMPQKSDGDIYDGQTGNKEGSKPGMVQKEQSEMHREGNGVGRKESCDYPSIEREVPRDPQGDNLRQNQSLVSEEQESGLEESEGEKSESEIRTDARRVSAHDGISGKQVRDLRNDAFKEAEDGPGRSLPQDRKGSRDSVLPMQHRTGAVSGQPGSTFSGDQVPGKIGWPDNCVDMVLTSIPFGTQYEYCPSVNDMGHNPSNDGFFEQLEFLIPNLLRVLKPGRVAAIHAKDRIRFGNVTGHGMPTVDRFSDKTADLFERHGFVMMARITIDTDVVRENSQTYRLGWSENAKDSSKMGAGMPEYVLVFRKLPSDQSNGYADVPVRKSKEDYTRAPWQIDAAGLWRSDGNRLPDPDILRNWSHNDIIALWRRHSLSGGYDHAEHVRITSELESLGKLPSSFMLFPPISRNKDIWTDITRMHTLNSEQSKRNAEQHLCPLQIDVIKRLITRYTNPGDTVLDPFNGIGSVVYQALKMGRRGIGVELNREYWRCSVGYAEMAENEITAPTLFDLAALEPVEALA